MASAAGNRSSKAARGSASTTRSTSFPSRIPTSNGIDCARPGSQSWVRVDVDLHDLQMPRVTFGEVFQHGRDHPTRPAPRRPEIDDNRHGRGRLDRERGAVRVDDPRQCCLAPWAARDSAVDRADAIARALQLGQPMIVTITRVERGGAALAWIRSQLLDGRLDPSPPRREEHASTGRSTPRQRLARRARGHAHGRDTGLRARRCVPIFAGAVTATPPARAPERDGAGRTTWSSFRSRYQSRLGRSPPSQCLPDPASAGNGAAATPPPAAAQAHAARHPPRERRRGCDRRVQASGERRARARTR